MKLELMDLIFGQKVEEQKEKNAFYIIKPNLYKNWFNHNARRLT